MLSRLRRHWWLPVAALLVVAGAVALLLVTRTPGDVSNPDVEFVEQAEPEPVEPPPGRRSGGGSRSFSWPIYGLTPQRTRYLPLRTSLRPPFTFQWAVRGSILLEFPPVAGGRQLFLLKNNGALYGISRRTGEVRWRRKLGYLAASSPAYADGRLYVTLLQRGRGIRAGRVAAISAATGRTIWSRPLRSRSESSPLVLGDTLYFGAEDGTVYAMRTRDGFVRWRHRVSGDVKGGLAFDRGKLFFGDYDGRMYAVDARTGRRVWTTETEGGRLGRSGNFYATPAVAYGRVYIGNTDGGVYSFSTRDGRLAWRKRTGGFVYSSPAIANRTVYVGSYDRRLYALDARTGRTRWSRDTGGRVSGGPVVIGDLVFVSTLRKTTHAYGASTGQPVWDTNKGAFNPAISDGERIYLVGYSSLFAMKPRESGVRARAERARRRGRARARAQAERQQRLRTALHGHRHDGRRRRGGRHCHRHRHVLRLRRGTIVVRHEHCHRHVRRR
jgi:outer membrane protein assembly factor BamB